MAGRSILIMSEEPNGEKTGPARIDQLSNTIITIDHARHHIHDGEMYQADHIATALADDASFGILIRLPDGQGAHMAFTASVGGNARLEVFEAPSVSADGTPFTSANRNRQSGNISSLLFFADPTVTVDGTLLVDKYVPGGTGNKAAGGSSESFAEWVLAPNTDYFVRLTNTSGAVQDFGIEIDWYEPLVV